MPAQCDACKRQLLQGERLQNWSGFWVCPDCGDRLNNPEPPPDPVPRPPPLPATTRQPGPDVTAAAAAVTMGMMDAVQSQPDGAAFDVIGGVIGRNVLLRMRTGELVMISVGEPEGLRVLARRPWGWKFPKQVYVCSIWTAIPDWGELYDGARLVRGSMVLGGMLCVLSPCRSVAEVESVCLAGFPSPGIVGAARWLDLEAQA